MQCNAPCLYQVCEAGSNGSWCGRGPRVLLCSRAELGLIQVGVASHGTKAADNKKSGPGFSVSLSPRLKSQPRTMTDWEKDHGSDESTTNPGLTLRQGVWLSLCAMNWPPPNQQVNMQKSFHLFLWFAFLLFFCFSNDHDAFLSGMLWWLQVCISDLSLFRLRCLTPLLLKTAG